MTNAIIKPEQAVSVFGVPARAFGVVADTETGRVLNQTIRATRFYMEDGHQYRITAELRFDDSCRNGHESFAITGDIDEKTTRGTWHEHSGGCIHEDIALRFPGLAHLIPWHLTGTDGPMHYIGNAAYLAGDRDFNGRAAGEPSAWSHGVRFGDSPVTLKLDRKFWEFLKTQKAGGIPNIEEVQHKNEGPNAYKFAPKYTVSGYPCEWYQCPFDNKLEALEFRQAFNTSPVDFVEVPIAFSEGKPRELEAARRAACWPEATDEELSVPRADLEAALRARLPRLLAAFRADIEAAGLLWPVAAMAEA